METRFIWDPTKAEKNRRIHGVSFETAMEVFSDPNHVTQENYFIQDQGEQRYGIIGMSHGLVLLLVIFVGRMKDGDEIIPDYFSEKGERL